MNASLMWHLCMHFIEPYANFDGIRSISEEVMKIYSFVVIIIKMMSKWLDLQWMIINYHKSNKKN